MPYVRVALMEPKPEHAQDVRDRHVEILRYDRTLPGFLGGYLIEPTDGSGRIGRMVLWESRADADHAAQQ